MPVEIKELVIRAVARREQTFSPDAEEEETVSEREALVEACVREVLQALRRTKER